MDFSSSVYEELCLLIFSITVYVFSIIIVELFDSESNFGGIKIVLSCLVDFSYCEICCVTFCLTGCDSRLESSKPE